VIERPAELGPRNPYAQIDPILFSWAEEYGLRLCFVDREDEVRCFRLRNARNRKYEVSLDYPADDGGTRIHIWRTDDRGALTIATGLAQLRQNLDSVYDLAMKGGPTGQPTWLPPPRWIRLLLRWLRLDTP